MTNHLITMLVKILFNFVIRGALIKWKNEKDIIVTKYYFKMYNLYVICHFFSLCLSLI